MTLTTSGTRGGAARILAAICICVGAAMVAQEPVTRRRLSPAELEQLAAQRVEQFVVAARSLPYVVEGLLTNANELYQPFPRAACIAHREAMQAARALAYHDPERLAEHVLHDEPMVRLWAAWGLYQLADARWLPALGAAALDPGSIPWRERQMHGWENADAIERWHAANPERCTRRLRDEVLCWLQAWGAPPPGTAEFGTWCGKQQQLAPTAACLQLKFSLATHGVSSTTRWDQEPLLAIMQAIDAAPRGAREIARLGLLHDKYQELLGRWPDYQILFDNSARRLGRDNLLRLLRGEPPRVDDTELAIESYSGFERGFTKYVLARADRIGLQADDAAELLRLGRERNDLTFFQGASRLRPGDALPILREALDWPGDSASPFDRTDCALLLWDLQHDAACPVLIDWFHEDPPNGIRSYPSRRQRFAVHLLHGYTRADLDKFAMLVADQRFERTQPSDLEHILGALRESKLVPDGDDARLQAHHPLGADRAFQDLEAARRTHPYETDVLLATVERWRAQIRAQVAERAVFRSR
jgi:hypothetical protein